MQQTTKETIEEIEENINGLLDTYDEAIRKAKRTKNPTSEAKYNQEAYETAELIEVEMIKLQQFSSFEKEIKLTTENATVH